MDRQVIMREIIYDKRSHKKQVEPLRFEGLKLNFPEDCKEEQQILVTFSDRGFEADLSYSNLRLTNRGSLYLFAKTISMIETEKLKVTEQSFGFGHSVSYISIREAAKHKKELWSLMMEALIDILEDTTLFYFEPNVHLNSREVPGDLSQSDFFKEYHKLAELLRLTNRFKGMPLLRLRFEVLKRDGYKCQLCGKSKEDKGTILEVDHKVPRSKGGQDTFDNLQTLCFECNRGKGVNDL